MNLYPPSSESEGLDSARQSQIEAERSEERSSSQIVNAGGIRTAFKVETVFDNGSGRLNGFPIQNILRKILPAGFFFSDPRIESLKELLPIVKWMEWEDDTTLSVFLLCYHRPNVAKFFYEMMNLWLAPGKTLDIGLFFFTHFKLPDYDDTVYCLCKMVVCFEEEQDREFVRNNLEIIENEIRLGVNSSFFASKILEVKGASIDQKTSLIQERISNLIKMKPLDFDYDIFGQMQHFLVSCKEEFKEARSYEHMSRMVYVFYLFRKSLAKLVEKAPDARHLSLKIGRLYLDLPLGMKRVLSIYVGVNFLKENEVFEEKHLARALRSFFPDIRIVEDSSFVSFNKENKTTILYLEVEKENEFTLNEIAFLKKELPHELKNGIELLVRPIFMPRNEEEIMRNILTLSNQLKYLKDIPQMIISFDEQTDEELSFTVIMLRILFDDTPSVIDFFHKIKTPLKFIPDRVKQVGLLRKKYTKEATVFKVKLISQNFLREDHSVDLYKARQFVVQELHTILGELRDYNGGMISKEIEMFQTLKEMLGNLEKKHLFLLENFLHSITPGEMRTVTEPTLLKTLFVLLLKLESENWPYKVIQENGHFFTVIKTEDESVKNKIIEMIDESSILLTFHFQVFETTYLGCICLNNSGRFFEHFADLFT